jgi:hypothetical protein
MTESLAPLADRHDRSLPDRSDHPVHAPPVPARTERWLCLAVWAGLLAAVLVFYLPAPARNSFLPSCFMRETTGLYCPGCGSTRAIHSLLHGRLLAAVRFNPLVTLLIAPMAAYGLLSFTLRVLKGKSLPEWEIPGRLVVVLLIVILGFGVLRNLPWFPFTLLAP